MDFINRILKKNRARAEYIKFHEQYFFQNISSRQTPECLWIGCSDSRVPPTIISGSEPGELFVHRNIGNVVIQTDINCMSVIEYAVCVLKIEHIIVCGHYNCGAVLAAFDDKAGGSLGNWLNTIRDIKQKHDVFLNKIKDMSQRSDKLSELNVIEQVHNVCNTPPVKKTWEHGRKLAVHGLIYNVHNGLLKDLKVGVTCQRGVSEIYRSAIFYST